MELKYVGDTDKTLCLLVQSSQIMSLFTESKYVYKEIFPNLRFYYSKLICRLPVASSQYKEFEIHHVLTTRKTWTGWKINTSDSFKKVGRTQCKPLPSRLERQAGRQVNTEMCGLPEWGLTSWNCCGNQCQGKKTWTGIVI